MSFDGRYCIFVLTAILSVTSPAESVAQLSRVERVKRVRDIVERRRVFAGDRGEGLKLLNAVDTQAVHDAAFHFIVAPLNLKNGALRVPSDSQLEVYRSALMALSDSSGRTRSGRATRYAIDTNRSPASSGRTESGGLRYTFIPEAAILHGVATYLVDRARAEVVVAFLQDVRRGLDTDTLLAPFLGRTRQILRSFDDTRASSIVGALQAAVRADLETLPDSLASDSLLRRLGAKDVNGMQALAVMLRVLRRVRVGGDLLDAVAALEGLSAGQMESSEMRSPMRLAGALARDLRDLPDDRRCSERMLLDDEAWPVRDHYLALLINDAIQSDEGLRSLVPSVLQDTQRDRRRSLRDFASRMCELQLTLQDYPQRTSDSPAEHPAGGVALAVLRLTGRTLQEAAEMLPDVTKAERAQEVKHVITVAVNLMGAVERADYTRTVTGMIDIFSTVARHSLKPAQLTLLSLVSALATAESADEVSSVLWAVAKPVGSFRDKRSAHGTRKREWRLTLNAYLGAGASREALRETKREVARSFSIQAPIGVEVAKPITIRGRDVGSLSFFVPAINVGNLAAVRLKHDVAQESPETGFVQAISPGLYGVVGITANRPFSVGVGVDYVSRLRRTVADGRLVNVLRVGVFAAIDMPLLSF